MRRLLFFSLAAAGVFAAVEAPAQKERNPIVALETNFGIIKIELYPDKAPITVRNFLAYVEDDFYKGTIFHRVIGKPNANTDFMIQGGGFEPGMKPKKTRDPIKNEAGNGLSNLRGTVAMARTSDPDSATSQFYINVADNTFLDRQQTKDSVGYCVFGRVIEGMDIVDRIKAVPVGIRDGHRDVPLKDVIIKSAKRVDR